MGRLKFLYRTQSKKTGTTDNSGFHVHDGVWVAADDREFAVRLARYCARNPVALSRLEYQSDNATGTYPPDKPTGPTAGWVELWRNCGVTKRRTSCLTRIQASVLCGVCRRNSPSVLRLETSDYASRVAMVES